MTQSGFFFDGPVSMDSEPIQKKEKPAPHPLLKADTATLKAAIATYATTAQDCSIDEVIAALGLPKNVPTAIRSAVLQVFNDPVNGLFRAELRDGTLRFFRKTPMTYGTP